MSATKTHEQFLKEANMNNFKVKVIGHYINQKTKIEVECLFCHKKYFIIPQSILRGDGCMECYNKIKGIRYRKSHDDFIQEVSIKNPQITVLSRYIKQTEKVLIKCNSCGYEEYMSPDKLLHRVYNCKICSDKISFPNRFVGAILDSSNIEYVAEKVFDWSDNKRYDFYIPSMNILLEVNGAQHYDREMHGTSIDDVQNNDEYKKTLALNNGISECNYIIIDARLSNSKYIWDNFKKSSLGFLLNNINKQDVVNKALKTSKLIQLVDLYNSGITRNVDLQKKLSLCKNTITTYMKKAKKLNLLNVA